MTQRTAPHGTTPGPARGGVGYGRAALVDGHADGATGGATTQGRITLRLLGPLEVRADDAVLAVSGLKQRAVLAVLGLQAGRVVAADDVVAAVWDVTASERTGHTLQQHVSSLRKVLEPARGPGSEPAVLITRPPGYVLKIDEVDAHTFEAAVTTATRAASEARWADAEEGFDAALAHWRGPALAEFRGNIWFDAVATRLEEHRLAAVETRADARLALGRTGEVVREVEALVEEHPYRERLHGLLALALYREGRQAEALGVLGRTRTLLADELGLEPGPELQRLERAILDHDPELARRVPPRDPDEVQRATYRPGEGLPTAVVRLPDGQIVSVAGGASLGRDPDAGIPLRDSRVSRRHARIDDTPDGYRLRDLGSTNGTTVDARRVDDHLLADGERIGLGGVELVFHARWPVDAPGLSDP